MSERQIQVLIVDDDPAICRLIERALSEEGFQTMVARNSEEMRKHVEVANMVLLDLNLPNSNGIELAREIREKYPNTAIIMVTGRTDEIDRIIGLEVGADDYVCKPFNARELVARVRSVLRRMDLDQAQVQKQMRFMDFVLDLESHELHKDGNPVELTGHEFKLLVMLAEKPTRVFTREEITRKVSSREWYPNDRSVDVLVSKLRNKLEADVDVKIIKSLRGVGYQFCANVEKL